jgi:hypothetical protein
MPFIGPSGGADPTNPELTIPYILEEYIGTETDPEVPIVLTGVESVGDEFATTNYYYYVIDVELVDETTPPDFDVVITQPRTVTIRTAFPDMFDRLIKFLVYDNDNTGLPTDNNVKTFLTVPRFADLPEIYTGVYEYVAPPTPDKTVTVRVNHYEYSESSVGGLGAPWGTSNPIGNPLYDEYITFSDWSFTLNENFLLSLQYMQIAIRSGTSNETAQELYPELINN